MKRLPIVDRVVRLAGGPARVGDRLGISSQAISQWKRIPAEYVLKLEDLTEHKFSRHEMRPDIFGPERESA